VINLIRKLVNWVSSFFLKLSVGIGVTPKHLEVIIEDDKYVIPLYPAVINFLEMSEIDLLYFLTQKRFDIVNKHLFSYLKLYCPKLSEFEFSNKDLSESIKFILDNRS
jgi:hypothetical protein